MSGLPDMMQDVDAYKNMQFLKVVRRKPDFPRSSKSAKKKKKFLKVVRPKARFSAGNKYKRKKYIKLLDSTANFLRGYMFINEFF